jgi:hypothetical protein
MLPVSRFVPKVDDREERHRFEIDGRRDFAGEAAVGGDQEHDERPQERCLLGFHLIEKHLFRF